MTGYKKNYQYPLITKILIVILIILLRQGKGAIREPLSKIYPCNENDNITIHYSSNPISKQNFQYYLTVDRNFFEESNIQVKFDSEATVTLVDYSNANISTASNSTFIDIHQFRGIGYLGLTIKGLKIGTLPHIQSIVINNVENCKHPQMGILDQYIQGEQETAEDNLSNSTCGRRKVSHFPAAHCVTIRSTPRTTSSLRVILGKYNLIGDDNDPQEREVQEIKVHERYEYQPLNNDIALLKLKTEVVFTDYVQPACLWYINAYKKIPYPKNFGTVVGWGFDQTKRLSSQLHQAKMPIVSELTCIKSHPVFFLKMLNGQKFCAGYRNGTAACNGDSGGGFMVFVPDVKGDASENATGAWHVRGVVSTSISKRDEAVCDPYHYVLFTDVAKFREWILRNIN